MTSHKELDVEALISSLNLKEKAKLLAGKDFWHFEEIPSAGIPPVRVSDGPNGVRGGKFFNGVPASCFPCATGIGASFDTELAEEIGRALGDECVAKGAHILLGPTANMQRSPLGGRGFESFGEDPVLSGMISSGYINGVQSRGVTACMKHFVANDQEFERFSVDSVVSQRALREIYLEPFRLAVKHSKPGAIMSAYNKVNGVHASENKELLSDVLREEWGWKGLIMSDWTGTYSVGRAISAGLDVEMPGPPTMRGGTIARQVNSGKLAIADVDSRVRAVLEMANRAIKSGIPFNATERSIDSPETRALLRKAASSAIVLLKNNKSVLPISRTTKRIAVIGSNAKISVPSGGGSAALTATYNVSPLQGITNAAKKFDATVEYAAGTSSFRYLPLLDLGMGPGKVEVFKESPLTDWYCDGSSIKAKPDWEADTNTSTGFMIDGVPWSELGPDPRTRFTTTFTPDSSGVWEFGISAIGGSSLFVDKILVVDNYTEVGPDEMWFGMGTEEKKGTMALESGRTYQIELRQSLQLVGTKASPFIRASAFRIGAYPICEPEELIKDAVALARSVDVPIVVVGTNQDFESEGFDRKHLSLPGFSNALVSAVVAVNPNTVVVTQSGTPITMPWINEASTVLHAFFGGNELGNGLADILFGDVNPSGKLSLTFPKRLEDNPSFHSFGITSPTPGKVDYAEGIYIGYRHYQRSLIDTLFPFAHGLSYTSFEFSSLSVSSVADDGTFSLSLHISNTGKIPGSEVIQVYIAAPVQGRITSPVKELKAFKKITLNAGQSSVVEIALEKEAFSYWDEQKRAWVVLAGKYKALVGTDSENVRLESEVQVSKTFTWVGL